MNTLPGSVDRRTGNVPLLGDRCVLHYEGREGDRPVVRIAASHGGRATAWENAAELIAYVAVIAELVPSVSTPGIADWLEVRMAEPARATSTGVAGQQSVDGR